MIILLVILATLWIAMVSALLVYTLTKVKQVIDYLNRVKHD